jgi:hypothetical protein
MLMFVLKQKFGPGIAGNTIDKNKNGQLPTHELLGIEHLVCDRRNAAVCFKTIAAEANAEYSASMKIVMGGNIRRLMVWRNLMFRLKVFFHKLPGIKLQLRQPGLFTVSALPRLWVRRGPEGFLRITVPTN